MLQKYLSLFVLIILFVVGCEKLSIQQTNPLIKQEVLDCKEHFTYFYNKIIPLMKNGKYREAQKIVNIALHKCQKHPVLQRYETICYYQLGEDKEALRGFRKIQENYSKKNLVSAFGNSYEKESWFKELSPFLKKIPSTIKTLKRIEARKNTEISYGEIPVKGVKNCYFIDVEPDPTISVDWTGECKDGLISGKGILKYKNGPVVKGFVKKGYLDGEAEILFSNGTTYKGGMKKNLFSGHGCMTYPDKTKYCGEFAKNMKNGKGTIYYTDGKRFIGFFKNEQAVKGNGYCPENEKPQPYIIFRDYGTGQWHDIIDCK